MLKILSSLVVLGVGLGSAAQAAAEGDQKADSLQKLTPASAPGVAGSAPAGPVGGGGYRTVLTNGEARVPLVVVGGTPYEMGWHLGRLLKPEVQQFLPSAIAGLRAAMRLSDEQLDEVWAATAAFTDDRFEQELLGLADGAGLSRRLVQRAHTLPLLMPYSCSSVAAWGRATADGHLYQTRDLDWNFEVGAHEFPAVVLYLPREGTAHVLPTFAGVCGANCGMSAAGLVLAEMGDSPAREMPYRVEAPHFTTLFRTLLYDADRLSVALDIFQKAPRTKRYHYVFGDGRRDKCAVKILAHSPEPPARGLRIWKDNDPADELAPAVLPGIVYQDEGRGAFPTLKQSYGRLDAARMMALANQIPIRGHNVLDAVFDATALRLWVSYAHGQQEAWQRPYVQLDLATLDHDGDGIPDIKEGAKDAPHNGVPDFLEDQRRAAR